MVSFWQKNKISNPCELENGFINDFIKLNEISKSYKNNSVNIEIVNNVDFEIKSGETIAVVGPSGIGKSTFLHILGTLDRPDSGKIYFKKENILKYDDTKLAKFRNQTIGFVFQFHHLLPEFTSIENVMMPALIKGENIDTAKTISEDILIKVGLKERLNHRVTDLSGGEQQRVALARALILSPKILLADEPTGNLDKKNSEQIHNLLIALNKEYNIAMVVVTHNIELANLMSKKITIIDGKLTELN
ncbi:MAG: ABC transporter ATP-binding protein [Desulfobacterales bacterium]|nr:ABC transporter ATP-binding protein [Desulfobacterales bacterium]